MKLEAALDTPGYTEQGHVYSTYKLRSTREGMLPVHKSFRAVCFGASSLFLVKSQSMCLGIPSSVTRNAFSFANRFSLPGLPGFSSCFSLLRSRKVEMYLVSQRQRPLAMKMISSSFRLPTQFHWKPGEIHLNAKVLVCACEYISPCPKTQQGLSI